MKGARPGVYPTWQWLVDRIHSMTRVKMLGANSETGTLCCVENIGQHQVC